MQHLWVYFTHLTPNLTLSQGLLVNQSNELFWTDTAQWEVITCELKTADKRTVLCCPNTSAIKGATSTGFHTCALVSGGLLLHWELSSAGRAWESLFSGMEWTITLLEWIDHWTTGITQTTSFSARQKLNVLIHSVTLLNLLPSLRTFKAQIISKQVMQLFSSHSYAALHLF